MARGRARARGYFAPYIDEKENELPTNYHKNYPSLKPNKKNYQMEYAHYARAKTRVFITRARRHTTPPVLVPGLGVIIPRWRVGVRFDRRCLYETRA